MSLVSAFVPIWILTAVGYAACRWGLLGEAGASVLGRFVFHLAMPAALFLALSRMPLSGFAGRPLLAFAVSTAVVLGFGWVGASRLFGRAPGERPIWGMAAGYVNSANLGIPIATQVLGDVSFLAEVVLLQALVVTPVILVALDRHSDPAGRVRVRRIASLPVRNPVILASLLGVACSAADLQLPSAADASLTLLAGAAVPAALVALGASLHHTAPSRAEPAEPVGVAELAVITALKLVAQPVIAYAAGLALHLSAPQLLAVVVCAGLPTAQNTFIFGQEYGVGQAFANRAVVVTTTLSLATLAAAATLLG
ncbi:AEC family transporter [Micromonospora gifhornensis]|uniref:Membrane protein n=1 Tax=Micromonospora gifhornensis TaxID=84594 RepID=A0ABQ4IHA2_9ACTN|nr:MULTISPECIES: AEC family transporter [Micromonospora]PMR61222.1 AEC family transporter [Verrucosispora sp. ts21]GIJ17294.1 membrane protein [Micromonospora gifhornensis]